MSVTDVSDDEGERDDVHPEKSHSEGTEAERSERTEEEFFEDNGSSSSTTSYSDNESVKSNFDEEDPFKWERVSVGYASFASVVIILRCFFIICL